MDIVYPWDFDCFLNKNQMVDQYSFVVVNVGLHKAMIIIQYMSKFYDYVKYAGCSNINKQWKMNSFSVAACMVLEFLPITPSYEAVHPSNDVLI